MLLLPIILLPQRPDGNGCPQTTARSTQNPNLKINDITRAQNAPHFSLNNLNL